MSGMVRIEALKTALIGGNGGPLHSTTPVRSPISSPLRPLRSDSVTTHALSPALTLLRGKLVSSSTMVRTVATPVHVVRDTPRDARMVPCRTWQRTTAPFSFSDTTDVTSALKGFLGSQDTCRHGWPNTRYLELLRYCTKAKVVYLKSCHILTLMRTSGFT